MTYNVTLEEKIEDQIARWKDVEKKKLFGGVCWMVRGNMAFGIWKDFLIVRLDKEQGEKSLKDKNVEPFAVTGKPMSGWIMVKEAGWKPSAGLTKWLAVGKEFALTLPEKNKKAKAKKKTLKEYNA